RAVEAVEARPLPADQRADLGRMRVRDDDGPFELRPAWHRALEPLELGGERLLGYRLRQRLERRVDLEAALLEVLVVVIPPELAADEIHECRVVGGTPGLDGDDAELSFLGRRERGVVDQPGIAHSLEHERAPRASALWIAARIVVRRAAHDRDE